MPLINVRNGTLEIARDGTVTANNRPVGTLQLFTVRAPEGLQSVGDSLFRATAQSGAVTRVANARLTQGSVEASNVDVADTMTEMMDAQRSFQLASKAVQMQDQLLQIANQVKS